MFIGGMLVAKYNIVSVLFIGGFLQMFSNLFFAIQGVVGVNTNVLMLTISIENLAGGIGTAAFLAYLSKLVDSRYIATQFALLTSFMALSRTQLSAPAGWMVEGIGWNGLFSFYNLEQATFAFLLKSLNVLSQFIRRILTVYTNSLNTLASVFKPCYFQ